MEFEENIIKAKNELKNIKKEVEKDKSFAMELLEYSKIQNQELKKQNKRQFIIILVVLTMWFITVGYLVYTLNDIGVMETSEDVIQENESGYNNYIGNDGDINNG